MIGTPVWADSRRAASEAEDAAKVARAAKHNQCGSLDKESLRKACRAIVSEASNGRGLGHCKDNGRGHEVGKGNGHDKDDDCAVSAG